MIHDIITMTLTVTICVTLVIVVVFVVVMQVMRRLWSTLACLGITRVYITGAEKVEKAYFGARILEPRAFMKELIIGGCGLEQAVGTQLWFYLAAGCRARHLCSSCGVMFSLLLLCIG